MSDNEAVIHKKFEERRAKLRDNTCDINSKLELIMNDLECILLAFPDGPIKHREAHEAWILAKESEKNFYDALKLEVMKKGVTGVLTLLVVILGLAITGFGHQLFESGFFTSTGGK